jgi:hypothetical protein
MSKLFNKISISLLLTASMGIAYANPGQFPEWRDGPRSGRPQRMEEQQDAQRREFLLRQQTERRRPGDAIGAPIQGSGQNLPGNNSYNAVPDSPQRPGRMTPEERRALRRQINEAGRDIYSTPR